MADGSTRKIVVIRNLPSNIIEEAILILKGEPAGKDAAAEEKNVSQKDIRNDRDFLIKEAEMLINNYMKEHNISGSFGTRTGRNAGSLPGKKRSSGIVINSLLAGSIMLLIFLMIKLL